MLLATIRRFHASQQTQTPFPPRSSTCFKLLPTIRSRCARLQTQSKLLSSFSTILTLSLQDLPLIMRPALSLLLGIVLTSGTQEHLRSGFDPIHLSDKKVP
jgi:hypothetical protein